MLQYSKYIILRLTAPMILVVLSLTGIAWLIQSLRFIDLIVNRGLSVSTFLYLSSLVLPSLLWVIIPIAVFTSVLYVYNKFTGDSELVVLKSAGVSKFGLIKPALAMSLIVTLFSYLIATYLLPASYREFKDMQSFIRDNYASLLLQEGIFTSPAKDLTVYIRERDDDGMLHGILVHDSRVKNKKITMMAEKGYLVKGAGTPKFTLINGNRQEMNKDSGEFSILYFEKYELTLNVLVTDKQNIRWREPQERYLNELFYPDDTADNLLQKLRAEGHYRITWPLYNIIVTLLALSAFISGEFNRRGNGKRMAIASSLAVCFLIAGIAINNITANNPAFTPMFYIVSIGGIAIITYSILREGVKSCRHR